MGRYLHSRLTNIETDSEVRKNILRYEAKIPNKNKSIESIVCNYSKEIISQRVARKIKISGSVTGLSYLIRTQEERVYYTL